MSRRRYDDDDAPPPPSGSGSFARGFGLTCGILAAVLVVLIGVPALCCGLGGLGFLGLGAVHERAEQLRREADDEERLQASGRERPADSRRRSDSAGERPRGQSTGRRPELPTATSREESVPLRPNPPRELPRNTGKPYNPYPDQPSPGYEPPVKPGDKTAASDKAAAKSTGKVAPPSQRDEEFAAAQVRYARKLLDSPDTIDHDTARERLEKVAKDYADTKAAAEARELLKALKPSKEK